MKKEETIMIEEEGILVQDRDRIQEIDTDIIQDLVQDLQDIRLTENLPVITDIGIGITPFLIREVEVEVTQEDIIIINKL